MRVTHSMMNRQLIASASQSYSRMASLDLERRITKPSDDPGGAQRLVQLRGLLRQNEQFQENSEVAYRWLASADTALSSLGEEYRNIRELALTAADSAMEMEVEGIIASLDTTIESIMSLANTRVGNSYLFGGSRTQIEPFERYEGGIGYHGDDTDLSVLISQGLSLNYNVNGEGLFGNELPSLEGREDWDARLTWDTELENVFDGRGAELGMIRITDAGGTSVSIDLAGCRTLGDLRDAVHTAFPGFAMDIGDGRSLQIDGGGGFRVEDLQGGVSAQVLGIAGSHPSGKVISRDLDPAITLDTPLDELMGLDVTPGSILVSVGYEAELEELDLSTATTVGDLVDLIEAEFPDLRVEVSASGNRLTISSDSYQPFEIKALEEDMTATLMGLEGSAVPIRPLEVLFELREAVANGDQQGVQNLLSEIEAVQQRITELHGQVGGRLAMAESAQNTLKVKNVNLTETLSKIGDADLTETLMLYQNAEASYQASLLLASNIYQLTLANFL